MFTGNEGFEVHQLTLDQLECHPIFPVFLHLVGPGADRLDRTVDLSTGDQMLPHCSSAESKCVLVFCHRGPGDHKGRVGHGRETRRDGGRGKAGKFTLDLLCLGRTMDRFTLSKEIPI
jgi:hypothetical protein